MKKMLEYSFSFDNTYFHHLFFWRDSKLLEKTISFYRFSKWWSFLEIFYYVHDILLVWNCDVPGGTIAYFHRTEENWFNTWVFRTYFLFESIFIYFFYLYLSWQFLSNSKSKENPGFALVYENLLFATFFYDLLFGYFF